MAVGLITFRLLFENLSTTDFGFYQLLWGTIGYAVLLDFGFGFAVQKAIAHEEGAQDNNHDCSEPSGKSTNLIQETVSPSSLATVLWQY